MVAWNWGNISLSACWMWKSFAQELRKGTIVNHWGSRRAKNSVRTMHITPNIKESLSMNFTYKRQTVEKTIYFNHYICTWITCDMTLSPEEPPLCNLLSSCQDFPWQPSSRIVDPSASLHQAWDQRLETKPGIKNKEKYKDWKHWPFRSRIVCNVKKEPAGFILSLSTQHQLLSPTVESWASQTSERRQRNA